MDDFSKNDLFDATIKEELERLHGQDFLKRLKRKDKDLRRSSSSTKVTSPRRLEPVQAQPLPTMSGASSARIAQRRPSQTIPTTEAEIAANIDPDLADILNVEVSTDEEEEEAAVRARLRSAASEPSPKRFAPRHSAHGGQIGFRPKARPNGSGPSAADGGRHVLW